jgi:hypothetical protein
MTTLKHMASRIILLQRTLALLFSWHLVRLVVALPLIKSPPPISSGWLSRCLSSSRRLPSAGASHCGIALCASCPSGWLSRLLASHTANSHPPAPPPLIAPLPLVTPPLLGLSLHNKW